VGRRLESNRRLLARNADGVRDELDTSSVAPTRTNRPTTPDIVWEAFVSAELAPRPTYGCRPSPSVDRLQTPPSERPRLLINHATSGT